MENNISRKDFIKLGTTAAAAASLGAAGASWSAAGAPGAEKFDPDGSYTVRIAGRTYCWTAKFAGGRLTELTRAPDVSTDLWLTRGLFDIQVNGYAGVDLTSAELSLDDLAKCESALLAAGITRWCPTVTSQTSEVICAALARIGEAVEKKVLRHVHCIHMEANFLSPEDGYRGAHKLEYITPPDKAEFESWQKAAGGRIGYVSLAPELEGGLEFVTWLAGQGILVALVHHNAPFDVIEAAVDAGARLSTHLFNGCAATLPRHHNVVLSQLSEDRLWASFLQDGHHIPYHVLKVGLRAKGIERSVFTSDLISLGGSPEGEYLIDGQEVIIRDGAAFLKETPYLYGAWSNLSQGIQRATAAGVVSPDEALRLASNNPARLFRVPGGLEVEAGAEGPFVFFRETGGALRLAGSLG